MMAAKVRVVFVFRHWENFASGAGPKDSWYGMEHFAADTYAVDFVARSQGGWGLARWVWWPFEQLVARATGTGFSLYMLQRWTKLRQADIIITTADAVGLPLLLAKRLGLIQAGLIYITQGLTDAVGRIPGAARRRLVQACYAWLLTAADKVVVLGEGALPPARQLFSLRQDQVAVVPYGIDAHFWLARRGPEADYILSVGSDGARDYEVLCQAAAGWPLRLVTQLPPSPACQRPEIIMRSDYSNTQLRAMYCQARVVVTPLRDVAQPSGQSATLQAMSCGAPVILTATRGLWERGYMRTGENCWLVPPGQVADLRAAIDRLWNQPELRRRLGAAGRRTVIARYTSRHLAERLMQLCREVTPV